MKKVELKADTMNETDSQKVYNKNIYTRDYILTTDKGFVNVVNGSM